MRQSPRFVASTTVLLALAGAAAGCTSTAPVKDAAPVPPPITQSLTLTALGDSIPAAANCPGCESFVELFGQQIAERQGAHVQVLDLGVSGWTSQDVLDSLAPASADAEAVRSSDVLTITIGANDFYPDLVSYLADDCGPEPLACFDDELAGLRERLGRVLSLVGDLRDERLSNVLVTGYWNVFTDGAVADELYGAQFLQDSAAVTRRVNSVIESVSTAFGATYVDLFEPFKGAEGANDPTALLADDGDHPNQAGHQKISEALVAAAGYGTTS